MNNKKKSRRKFSRSNSKEGSNLGSRKSSEDFNTEEEIKINLHTKEINSAINNDNVYRKDGIKLKNFEGGKDPLYIGEIDSQEIKYIGVLDINLKRSGVGLNVFKNGDKCLGIYENDFVNKNGFYYYKPETEGGVTKSQFYWGQFRNGCKDGRGISLWLTENEGNKLDNFDEASFDAFIGKIEINRMCKGIYFSKKQDVYTVYYGEFDSRQKKKGDNCFYYKAENDTLLYGKMEKDLFTNGFLGTFDENGNIVDILQCEFDEENNITDYANEDNINNVDELKKKMSDVRNTLLAYDVFGLIYNSFKDAVDFVDKIKGTEQFEDQDFYPKILTKITGYNAINILKEVEDVL